MILNNLLRVKGKQTMLLTAQNLIKRFKNRTVVNGASFHIEQGEVVGLLGPNGAGKTTSFYMTVGLITPDEGEVFIDDKEITQSPMHIRAQLGIGYLPQEASIFRKMSSRDNILAICQTRKDLSPQAQQELTDELLEDFKITHIANSLGISLSGGERRRVEIARSLALNPKSIILQLSKRNIGILITDHNIRETLSICERSYILSAGTVIAEGDTEYLLNHEDVRRVYLGENFSL